MGSKIQELAERFGVTYGTAWKWKSGIGKIPDEARILLEAMRNAPSHDNQAKANSWRVVGKRKPFPSDEPPLTWREERLRTRTRKDCQYGPRPCPWVSCRHNLLVDVTRGGSLHLLNEGEEMEETCALDVAEKGEHTLEEVGQIMRVTREMARLLERTSLRKLRMYRCKI